MPTLRPLNSIINQLATVIATAKSSDLADLQADLESADVGADQWNSHYRQPNSSEIPVSPTENMGGATGADRMISHWSEKTGNDMSPTAMLGAMVSRMDSFEGVLKALMGHIFKADVSDEDRFPNSETTAKKTGDETDDRDEEKSDDDDDVSKSIATLSLKDAFSYLQGRTTKAAERAAKAQEARDIRLPPNMMPIITKANSRSLRTIVADTISTGIRPNGNPISEPEELGFRQLHNALMHTESGHAGAETTVQRLRQQLAI